MNFRNYLLRICSSWALPQGTQDNPFHDSGSYSRALGLLLEGMQSGESVATDAASCNGKQQRLREGFMQRLDFLWLLGCLLASFPKLFMLVGPRSVYKRGNRHRRNTPLCCKQRTEE